MSVDSGGGVLVGRWRVDVGVGVLSGFTRVGVGVLRLCGGLVGVDVGGM